MWIAKRIVSFEIFVKILLVFVAWYYSIKWQIEDMQCCPVPYRTDVHSMFTLCKKHCHSHSEGLKEFLVTDLLKECDDITILPIVQHIPNILGWCGVVYIIKHIFPNLSEMCRRRMPMRSQCRSNVRLPNTLFMFP